MAVFVRQNLRGAFDRLVDPLMTSIRRELGSIIARLHRVDFGDKAAFDPMSQGAGGPSGYMKDLVEKLEFVRSQILARYSVGALNSEW